MTTIRIIVLPFSVLSRKKYDTKELKNWYLFGLKIYSYEPRSSNMILVPVIRVFFENLQRATPRNFCMWVAPRPPKACERHVLIF